MKKNKILGMILSVATLMSTAGLVTPTGVYAGTETVDIFSDDFSGTTLNSAWKMKGMWNTTSNCWKLKDGVLYDYEADLNWCTAARAIDVSALPDEYDLNVEYRVQVDDPDAKGVGFITMLGTEPVSAGNLTAGKQAATISLNGDQFAKNGTGIYYTIDGSGIELYGAADGYSTTDWYTINIVAHVDGVNNATFDYKVYNSDKTNLLASVDNVSTKADYAGSVVEPTYVSFIKHNVGKVKSSASLDDVKVWATYEGEMTNPDVPVEPEIIVPAGMTMATLLEDDFSDSTLKSTWKINSQWGNPSNEWRLSEGTLFDSERGQNYAIASHEFDVSELPDEYELHVSYKAKATDSDSTFVGLLTTLGTQAAPSGNYEAGKNAMTISFNGGKNGKNVTGVHYTTNGDPIALYDGSMGFDDENWYHIEIIAHINGVDNATFDYKVYNADKTVLLAEIYNVSTKSYAGSVVEPTYISFDKKNQDGHATTAAIDDVLVYALYEDLPEYARKQSLFSDNFSGSTLKSTWKINSQWGNPLNEWRLSDGTLYDSEQDQNYTIASHEFDVSELPDEYDLYVTYKAKATDSNSTFVGLLTTLGTQAAPSGNYEAGKNAMTISFNGGKNGKDVTGIHYTTSGDPIALYDGSMGFDDENWYQIEIIAHINGVDNATFDYKVYNAEKTMLLAEVYNVSTTTYAGSVVEPTYISFDKKNAKGHATTAAIDDINIYAYWEMLPVEVEGVKALSFDGSEKDLTGEIENNFKAVKVTFADALKEAPVITLSGEELEVTANGNEYIATLPSFLNAGTYTLDVTYAGETTSYTFTVKAATELLISEFAWYNGETEIKDFADLATGTNNLTLKVVVYNLTGAEKDLILGYATYANKYMKAVNFNEAVKVAADGENKEYTIPVTVNKSDADKLSGFVWENLTGLKPLAEAAILD